MEEMDHDTRSEDTRDDVSTQEVEKEQVPSTVSPSKTHSQESVLVKEDEENSAVVLSAKSSVVFKPLDGAVVKKLISRFINVISIPDFNSQMLQQEHLALIEEFVTDSKAKRLLVYIDDSNRCVVQATLPNKVNRQVMYFIKESTGMLFIASHYSLRQSRLNVS